MDALTPSPLPPEPSDRIYPRRGGEKQRFLRCCARDVAPEMLQISHSYLPYMPHTHLFHTIHTFHTLHTCIIRARPAALVTGRQRRSTPARGQQRSPM